MTYDRRTHTLTCPDCGHVERTEPLMCSGKDVTTINDAAYLKGTDRENTKRYLIRKYLAVDPDGLSLDLKLTLEPPAYPVLDPSMLDNLQPCEYLAGRGIDYETQARYRVGYHTHKRAAVLPWFDTEGRLVNVKYRSVEGKAFRCADGRQALSNHLFGYTETLHADTLLITEAEIDTLYLATHGYASFKGACA